jgi:predicted outer membrane repeat protein
LGVKIEPGTAISYSSATGSRNSEGGGGLAAAFCDVRLEGVSFTNNVAIYGNGGAALLGNGVEFMAIKNAVFKNNRASDSGGALACTECESVLLAGGTRFEGNEAHVNGGAISIVKPGSPDPTSSSGSVFRSNTAETGNGGAVYIVHDTEENGEWQSYADDVFEENTALEGSGGAFFAMGTKALFAEGVSCEKNRAMKGGGGCIMWEPLAEDASSSLWNSRAPVHAQSLFDDNRAAFGNDKATPPVSLRPIVDANVNISAIVDGGSLEPAPRVEILDLYGQVVPERLPAM